MIDFPSFFFNVPFNTVPYLLWNMQETNVIKDTLFERITENQSLIVVTNVVIPLAIAYIIYLNGEKNLVMPILKYALVMFAVKLLYKYLRREPDPKNASRNRDTINLLYAFVIISVLVFIDKRVLSFGNVNLLNTQLSLSKLAGFLITLGYGYLLIKVRSGYSTDLLTTMLLTYFIYSSNIFYEIPDDTLRQPVVNSYQSQGMDDGFTLS